MEWPITERPLTPRSLGPQNLASTASGYTSSWSPLGVERPKSKSALAVHAGAEGSDAFFHDQSRRMGAAARVLGHQGDGNPPDSAQLRLIREQTSAFRSDLLAVRREIDSLKASSQKQEVDTEELATSIGTKVNDALAWERQDRDVSLGTLVKRITHLEREMPSMREHSLQDLKALLDRELELHAGNHQLLERRCHEHSDALGRHAQLHQDADRKLAAHRQAVEKDMDSAHTGLGDVFGKHASDHHDRHVSMADRLTFLEKELESTKMAHGKLSSDAKATEAQHATLGERLGYVERLLGDSAESAKELRSLQQRLQQQHGRFEQLHGAHGSEIDGLKKAHDEHNATLKERVEYLEKSLGDSADRHAKEIEEVRKAHRERDGKHEVMVGKIEQLCREKEALHSKHSMMEDRLTHLAKTAGGSAEQARAIEDRHATVEERLNFIEKIVGDSANLHKQELVSTQSRVEQLHRHVSDERKSREMHHSGFREQLSAEKDRRESHHASMDERLAFLEKSLGESADRHAKELEASHGKLADSHKVHQAKFASVEERLVYIEKWFRGFQLPG